MKQKSFRFCMLVGALALLGVAGYYFSSYAFKLKVALDNNNLELFLVQSIKALWLAFASQGLLIGMLYLLVAYKPSMGSRGVVALLAVSQAVEAALLYAFEGSKAVVSLLAIAAVFVLVGAALWPKRPVKAPTDNTAYINT